MKKIIKCSLILFIIMYCLMGTVYSALNCNVNMQFSKTELSKDEVFTVDINLSNVQADRGIISLGARLDYDKEVLELIKVEGKNGWETPSEDSFNQNNGIMAITRSSVGKKDETVLTVTFKVKEVSKKEAGISLKDIVVADGDKPVKVSGVSKNLTIKGNTQNPDKPENNTSNDKDISNNDAHINNNIQLEANKVNNVEKDNTNKDITKSGSILPHAGNKTSILIIFIGIAIILVITFLLKIKFVNK